MILLNDSGHAMLAMFGLFVVCAGVAVAETEPPGDWQPQSEYAGKFDWSRGGSSPCTTAIWSSIVTSSAT
jgi:hypothetical protein